MNGVLTLLLALTPVVLIAMIGLPNAWVNRRAGGFRHLVTLIVGVQFLLTAVMLVAHATGRVPAIHSVLASFSDESPIALTIHYDGVASLMLTLVSFVGFVINS